MDKTIRNMIFIAVLFFAVAFDCCYHGTRFDEQNKLYPEYEFTCTDSYEVYGMRWQRFGFALFCGGFGSLIAIPIFLARKRAARKWQQLSIYHTEPKVDQNFEWKNRQI